MGWLHVCGLHGEEHGAAQPEVADQGGEPALGAAVPLPGPDRPRSRHTAFFGPMGMAPGMMGGGMGGMGGMGGGMGGGMAGKMAGGMAPKPAGLGGMGGGMMSKSGMGGGMMSKSGMAGGMMSKSGMAGGMMGGKGGFPGGMEAFSQAKGMSKGMMAKGGGKGFGKGGMDMMGPPPGEFGPPGPAGPPGKGFGKGGGKGGKGPGAEEVVEKPLARAPRKKTKYKHDIVCGELPGNGTEDGRISCGLLMYRDKKTGAPYIIPLYTQPKPPRPPVAKRHGLVCGVSAGDDGKGDGRISCGVPMYRDKKTGAPYIVPLFTQPHPNPDKFLANRPILVISNDQSANSSARLRQEALDVLRRFLDAAPGAGFEAHGSPGLYPVPGSGGGMQPMPDMGFGGGAPLVPGPGPGAGRGAGRGSGGYGPYPGPGFGPGPGAAPGGYPAGPGAFL